MEPNEYELRTADAGVPPTQATTAPAGSTAIDNLPVDALILISTRNLVLSPVVMPGQTFEAPRTTRCCRG